MSIAADQLLRDTVAKVLDLEREVARLRAELAELPRAVPTLSLPKKKPLWPPQPNSRS